MTGDEHFAEAERLLAMAASASEGVQAAVNGGELAWADVAPVQLQVTNAIAAAHVHALLSTAAGLTPDVHQRTPTDPSTGRPLQTIGRPSPR